VGLVSCHLWQHDIYCNLLLLLLLAGIQAATGYLWKSLRIREVRVEFFSKLFFVPAGVSFVPRHLLFSFPSASVLRGSQGATHNPAHAPWGRGRAEGKESAAGAGLRWLHFQQSVGREGREIQISIYRHQNPALSILQREGKQRLGYPAECYSQSTTSTLTKARANSCSLPACQALSYMWVVLPSETACIICWVTFFNLTESKLQFHFLRAILETNTEVVPISLWLHVKIELSRHAVPQTEHRFSLSPPPTCSTSTVFMPLSEVPTWGSCNAQVRREVMN